MKILCVLMFFVAAIVMSGCETEKKSSEVGDLYFKDPATAVAHISKLLKEKKWPELALYYDLNDSPVEIETLLSGEFFYTDEKPESAHPGAFWHYKHPFSPAFKFSATRELEDPNVVEVTVSVEIDQGGGMIQRGTQSFLMRKSAEGYQIMPHKAPAL